MISAGQHLAPGQGQGLQGLRAGVQAGLHGGLGGQLLFDQAVQGTGRGLLTEAGAQGRLQPQQRFDLVHGDLALVDQGGHLGLP